MTTETPTEPGAHPRPQFRRANWTDLCGSWRFGYDEELDRTIQVPFPPESKLSGVHDTAFHPVVWYERQFTAPTLSLGERLLLHFGAVDYHAAVWVNGQHVGEHTGGHTPFSFDITDALTGSDAQTIVVRAEDQPTDASQPRGKQARTLEPQGVFYDRTTGIWQPVWLEVVPDPHIASLAWTPDLAAGTVELELTLDRRPESPRTLEIQLCLDDEVIAEHAVRITEGTAHTAVTVPGLRDGRQRLLWSPEAPNLLDARLVLRGGPDQPDDEVHSYVGLREVGFRDGLFMLNGKPYYLRMVLEQGFWPDSHLAAPSPDALRDEVELIKQLGFTGARVHQKMEDPRFLYWCDRLGLLVWGELANTFEFSNRAVDRTVSEWLAVVERDRSHPCVVAWVPLNESWGVPRIATSERQRSFATSLYHLTKAVDPTRPVISNDGWEHTVSDIWSVHDYTPNGKSIRARYGDPEALHRTLYGAGPGRRKVLLTQPERSGEPVVITEFGGLSYTPTAGEKWFGYGTVESPEALRDRLSELVSAILDSPELAGFCYTQLTDTQQEKNGLLTEDRTPKLPIDTIREIITQPSKAIPSELVDVYRRAAVRRTREEPNG